MQRLTVEARKVKHWAPMLLAQTPPAATRSVAGPAVVQTRAQPAAARRLHGGARGTRTPAGPALVKTKDKKIKADLGEQSRTLYTTNSAAWDAKNRFNLPTEITIQAVEFGADGTIPAEILPAELAAVFAGTAAPVVAPVRVVQPIAGPAAAAVVAPSAPVTPPPAPAAPAAITAEQRAKLEQYGAISMCAKVISAALNHYVLVDVVELTEAQAALVIGRCQDEMNKPAAPVPTDGPGFLWPASCREWLTANAPEANAYLHKRGHITATQTWANLPIDRAEKIAEHFEAFKKSAVGGAK